VAHLALTFTFSKFDLFMELSEIFFQILGALFRLYKNLTISSDMRYVGDIKGWIHTYRPRSAPIDTYRS